MIRLKDITFGYGARTLLDGLEFHVRPGDRIGLVGPNGSGKTTLLRIIAGDIEDYTGNMESRKELSIGLLPQEGIYTSGHTLFETALEPFSNLLAKERRIEQLDAGTAAETDPDKMDELAARAGRLRADYETGGGFEFRANTARVLTGLGFAEKDFERDTGEFSGGWQMRIALAKLLLARPDVLLLDEPTNHLDLPAIIWFESFLSSFDGALIVVSHDRFFLDRTVHRIAELASGKLDTYNGNYSFHVREKEKRLEVLRARIENQRREIRHHERFIERFRYKAKKARQVQGRIKMVEKIEALEDPGAAKTLSFSFSPRRTSGKEVLRLEDVSKDYDGNVVLDGAGLVINRGDRVAVVGANGLGKSTLMRVIAGRTEFSGNRRVGHHVDIGYFSQDQYELLSPHRTVLEEADDACGKDFEGSVRSLLGVFLFSGDEVEKKVSVLSGGEKSRLLMAKLMADPANFLVLDEPTNHLDPPSQDMLLDVLSGYGGTVCFVSHDRYFINRLATRVIEVTPGGLEEYLGNYDDFELHRKLREDAENENARESSNGGGRGQNARKAGRRERARFVAERSRALKPLRREIEKLETEIQEHENRIRELEAELADPATYENASKTQELPAELKSAGAKLEHDFRRSLTNLAKSVIFTEFFRAAV